MVRSADGILVKASVDRAMFAPPSRQSPERSRISHMRIAIYGAGGLGACYGARLAFAGHARLRRLRRAGRERFGAHAHDRRSVFVRRSRTSSTFLVGIDRQGTIIAFPHAPVAQLDRVPGYEPGGREFESLRARQPPMLRTTGVARCGLRAPRTRLPAACPRTVAHSGSRRVARAPTLQAMSRAAVAATAAAIARMITQS